MEIPVTEDVKAPAQPTKAPAIAPHLMVQADLARIIYRMNVPAGVPVSRVLEPDYFAHVASMLRPGFRIEALAQDGKWFADLLVRKSDKERHEVHVWALSVVDLEKQIAAAAPAQADDYRVEFGGAHKWRVVRGQEVIHKGEASEGEARAWLAEHLKTVAA